MRDRGWRRCAVARHADGVESVVGELRERAFANLAGVAAGAVPLLRIVEQRQAVPLGRGQGSFAAQVGVVPAAVRVEVGGALLEDLEALQHGGRAAGAVGEHVLRRTRHETAAPAPPGRPWPRPRRRRGWPSRTATSAAAAPGRASCRRGRPSRGRRSGPGRCCPRQPRRSGVLRKAGPSGGSAATGPHAGRGCRGPAPQLGRAIVRRSERELRIVACRAGHLPRRRETRVEKQGAAQLGHLFHGCAAGEPIGVKRSGRGAGGRPGVTAAGRRDRPDDEQQESDTTTRCAERCRCCRKEA